MKKPPPNLGLRVFAAATAFVGPLCSVQYEHGRLPFFLNDTVHNLWLLVIIAGLCMAVGVVSFIKRARIIGTLCFLSNCAVLGLYGFIAAFFALGYSR